MMNARATWKSRVIFNTIGCRKPDQLARCLVGMQPLLAVHSPWTSKTALAFSRHRARTQSLNILTIISMKLRSSTGPVELLNWAFEHSTSTWCWPRSKMSRNQTVIGKCLCYRVPATWFRPQIIISQMVDSATDRYLRRTTTDLANCLINTYSSRTNNSIVILIS